MGESEPTSTSRDLQLKSKEAYERVVVKYENLIKQVVSGILSGQEQRHKDLEEYVNEALMHTLNAANQGKMNDIPDSRRLVRWIRTTIQRWAIDQRRRNSTEKSRFLQFAGESAIRRSSGPDDSSRIGMDLVAVESDSPESQIEEERAADRKEIVKELEAIAHELGPNHAALITALLEDPDRSQKQLADILEVSTPTVRKLFKELQTEGYRAGLNIKTEDRNDGQ